MTLSPKESGKFIASSARDVFIEDEKVTQLATAVSSAFFRKCETTRDMFEMYLGRILGDLAKVRLCQKRAIRTEHGDATLFIHCSRFVLHFGTENITLSPFNV